MMASAGKQTCGDCDCGCGCGCGCGCAAFDATTNAAAAVAAAAAVLARTYMYVPVLTYYVIMYTILFRSDSEEILRRFERCRTRPTTVLGVYKM
jgi:hypothetical protein